MGRFKVPEDVDARVHAVVDCEYARALGIKVLSITPDEVRLEMELEGKLNGYHVGHGGAVFALADQAFSIAANQGRYPQVATSARIRYIRPAQGTLTASSRLIAEDEKTTTYLVSVSSGDELVAEFEGVGHKLKR